MFRKKIQLNLGLFGARFCITAKLCLNNRPTVFRPRYEDKQKQNKTKTNQRSKSETNNIKD